MDQGGAAKGSEGLQGKLFQGIFPEKGVDPEEQLPLGLAGGQGQEQQSRSRRKGTEGLQQGGEVDGPGEGATGGRGKGQSSTMENLGKGFPAKGGWNNQRKLKGEGPQGKGNRGEGGRTANEKKRPERKGGGKKPAKLTQGVAQGNTDTIQGGDGQGRRPTAGGYQGREKSTQGSQDQAVSAQ